jgi:predicted neutral ceramidase superfamily lipid hydrolase
MDDKTPAMKRSPRELLIYFLSMLFAATPFAFALVRAFRTGNDFRFLWMAFASFLGAAVIIAVGRSRNRKPKGVLAPSALVLIVATLLAGVVAFLLGAKSVAGAGIVALAFGLCWAASYALNALSRPRMI